MYRTSANGKYFLLGFERACADICWRRKPCKGACDGYCPPQANALSPHLPPFFDGEVETSTLI